MKVLLVLIAWCLLLVLCWPLAVLALILFPVVWLLLLPLRLIGITVDAGFALIKALFFCLRACWDAGDASVRVETTGNAT
jgi:hypothetical protein